MARRIIKENSNAVTEAKVVDIPKPQDDIEDIQLSTTVKKRFRVDGDNNRILELNTSDAGIIPRLNDLYPEMRKIGDKLAVMIDDSSSDDETFNATSNAIKELDAQLKEMLDKLFDANVSEVCIPFGTAVDPVNGEFKFETIIRKLGKLYTDNFNREFDAMQKKVSKHTAKYTKSRKR